MNRFRPVALTICIAFLADRSASVAPAQDVDVPKLIEILKKDKKPEQARARRNAVRALGDLGEKLRKEKTKTYPKLAVKELLEVLKNDEDGNVRDEAEEALKKIGEPAVTDLVGAMKDKDEFFRLRVVRVFGGMGPEAKAALPVLRDASTDTSEFVREAAKEAYTKVASDLPTIIKALKDKDAGGRLDAIKALLLLGPYGKPAATALCDVVKDKNKEVRQEAVKALGVIGKEQVKEMTKDPRTITPALRNSFETVVRTVSSALQDADDVVRINAATALGEIGPPAASLALPALARALQKDKSDEFREAADAAAKKLQAKKGS